MCEELCQLFTTWAAVEEQRRQHRHKETRLLDYLSELLLPLLADDDALDVLEHSECPFTRDNMHGVLECLPERRDVAAMKLVVGSCIAQEGGSLRHTEIDDIVAAS